MCDDIIKKELLDIFENNKFSIVSSNNCKACVDAKNLLKSNDYKFKELDITSDENDKYFNCVFQITRSNYIPQIFYKKKFIGGYNELKYLHMTGLLQELI